MGIMNCASIRAKTAAARKQLAADRPVAASEPLDKKGEAIRLALTQGSWGCQEASVYRLVKAITGYDIPKPTKTTDFAHHQFVIGAIYVYKGIPVIITSVDEDGDASFLTSELVPDNGSDDVICADENFEVASDTAVETFMVALGL